MTNHKTPERISDEMLDQLIGDADATEVSDHRNSRECLIPYSKLKRHSFKFNQPRPPL